MTTKSNLQCLLEVVDMIDFEHFDMTSYYCHLGDHPQPEPMITDCGTTACLAGWGTIHPTLKERGLHFIPAMHSTIGALQLVFGQTDAETNFFGISNSVKDLLFHTHVLGTSDEKRRLALRERVEYAISNPYATPQEIGQLNPDMYGFSDYEDIGCL